MLATVAQPIQHFGGYALLVAQTLRQCLKRPFEWRRTFHELDALGVQSFLVVGITALFTGMVLALQSAYALAAFGAKPYIAKIVSLSVVRELGPVLTALMFAGRVGSGIAAEIGSMAVTDQIDAVRTLGASPVKKIVVPKFLAVMVMLPCLTILSDVIGILGGLLIAVAELQVPAAFYLSRVEKGLLIDDVMSGFSKSFFFGFLISTIGCYNGLSTTGGADGVGRATTRTVVQSSIAILISDFFLTKLFLAL